MTVTWKDYDGPNLGEGHKSLDWVENPCSPEALERDPSACCKEEIEARKKWADEQNAKLAPGKVIWDPETQKRLRDEGIIRQFETGANRDTDTGKLDYEGFLSPLVLRAFATFMNFNRSLADGSTRDSDNWQRGIPLDVYMKSGWRHFLAAWSIHRGWGAAKETIVWALCGVLFNVMGYLHELLKKDPELLDRCLEKETEWRNATRSAAVADVSPPRPSTSRQ